MGGTRCFGTLVFVVASISAKDAQATTDYVQKDDGAGGLEDSLIYDDGTKIGFGTASPSGYFHFKSSGGMVIERSSKNLVLNPNWGGSGSYAAIYTALGSDMQLRLGVNQSMKMTITTGGDVGIGDTSPSYRLDVNGTGRYTGTLTLDSDLTVDTSTLKVDAANNRVGIGDSTPTYTLDVAGTGRFTGNVFMNADLDVDADIVADTVNTATQIKSAGTGANALHVDGGSYLYGQLNCAADNSSTCYYQNGPDWWTSSDQRLKKNVTALTGALDLLTQLEPVQYEWHDDVTGVDGYGDGIQVGFIAQDVEAVFPTWVKAATPPTEELEAAIGGLIPEGGTIKGLQIPTAYKALVVQSIKELRAENLDQKAYISALEEQVWSLKALVCVDHPAAATCNE